MRIFLALVFAGLSSSCSTPPISAPVQNGPSSGLDCSEYAKTSARLGWSDADRDAKSNENQSRKLDLGFGTDTDALPPSHSRPRPLQAPRPTTPYCAVKYGLSGTCEVIFDVSAEGIPINLDPFCSDSIFNKEVVRAVSAVRFAPATIDGVPVEYPGVIYPINFEIQSF